MRGFVAGCFVLVGLLVAPLGVAGVWTQRELLVTESFTDLAVDVLHQPEVGDALAARLTDEVIDRADLGSDARLIVKTAVTRVIRTPEFESIFRVTVGGMHEQLERGDDALELRFDDALPLIKQTAAGIDASVAEQIPTSGLPVVTVVRQSDAPEVWRAVDLARQSSLVFPLVVVTLLGVAILVAPKRPQMTIVVGVGLLIVAIGLVLLVDLGRDVLADVAGPGVEIEAFDAGYDVVASSFANQTAFLGALGVAAGVLGGVALWRQDRNWRSEEWA